MRNGNCLFCVWQRKWGIMTLESAKQRREITGEVSVCYVSKHEMSDKSITKKERFKLRGTQMDYV